MAWSSSYDGNRILSINQMNSAKSGYNIFNYSSDKCPTKSELLATSVTTGGYTYRVTISGSYADNQLVPNSALNVSSTSNSYTLYVNIHMTLPNGCISYWDAQDQWDNYQDGDTVYFSSACDATIYLYDINGNLYTYQDDIVQFEGYSLVGGMSSVDYYVQGISGYSGDRYFSIPGSTKIGEVYVELGGNCGGGTTVYIPSASQGKNYTANAYIDGEYYG